MSSSRAYSQKNCFFSFTWIFCALFYHKWNFMQITLLLLLLAFSSWLNEWTKKKNVELNAIKKASLWWWWWCVWGEKIKIILKLLITWLESLPFFLLFRGCYQINFNFFSEAGKKLVRERRALMSREWGCRAW